jgi:hypothetical protein
VYRMTITFIAIAAALSAHADDNGLDNLTRLSGGTAVRCHAGICHTAEDVLDFATSKFPPPPVLDIFEPDCMADCKAYAALYYDLSPADAHAVVDRLWAALQQHPGLDFERELAFLTAAVRFESHGRESVRGAAGELGVLQCHPVHRSSMKRAGLDFDNPDDRLEQCMLLLEARGHQPWSVRRKAESEARRILGGK